MTKSLSKIQILSELLGCLLLGLQTFSGLKTSYILFTMSCFNYYSNQRGSLNKNFPRQKVCLYFDWMTNESRNDKN